MTATYTWDVFSTLDGFGSYGPDGDWGGHWSSQGPELLDHRAATFDTEQHLVLGATTFRENEGRCRGSHGGLTSLGARSGMVKPSDPC